MPRIPSIPDLVEVIGEMQRQIAALQQANPLQSAVIGKGGVRSADFDGSGFSSPGTAGNYFGADGAVLNNLLLRPGSVSNNALSSPVSPATAHNDAGGWSVTTSLVAKATATVAVPVGYSRALVIAVGQAGARNSTSAQDFLTIEVNINGTGFGYAANIDSLATASVHPVTSVTVGGSALLTSLGASFTIKTMVATGLANWAADPYNTANIDAIILFLR